MKAKIKDILNRIGVEITRYPSIGQRSLLKILVSNNFNIVLDVGANTGSYAREIRTLGYKGKIVSFEPQKGPFNALMKYAQKSKYEHLCLPYALGEKNEFSFINISNNSVSSSILNSTEDLLLSAPEARFVGQEQIRVFKLDTLFNDYVDADNDIVFLKLDVQGYEQNVLAGSKSSIQHIKGLQMEVPLVELYTGERLLEDTIRDMHRLNFQLHLILPGFTDMNTGRLLEVDCVFLQSNLKGDYKKLIR